MCTGVPVAIFNSPSVAIAAAAIAAKPPSTLDNAGCSNDGASSTLQRAVISACSAGRLRRTIKSISPESPKRSETMAEWKTDYIPGPPRIAVDHCGAGPLVIFMHGIGGNRSNWHDQL